MLSYQLPYPSFSELVSNLLVERAVIFLSCNDSTPLRRAVKDRVMLLRASRDLLSRSLIRLRDPRNESQSVQLRKAMSTWTGEGTQEDFMHKDECILVSEQDEVVGHCSKHECHRFAGQQTGILHRAFSVFLFDAEGRLLLQQRASGKVTFPSVWTNTCCSHPLVGQSPDEVDLPQAVQDGSVPGVRYAAIRKLEHELGIPGQQLPLSGFKFLTRLHYCAPDVKSTSGSQQAEWGEHEMDYILFIQAPDASLRPNPEEVDAVRYVTLAELKEMMLPSSGLRWSPWFRIIAERFLPQWWTNLQETLTTDHFDDWGTIHHILVNKHH